MRSKFLWILVSCLIVLALLVSCSPSSPGTVAPSQTTSTAPTTAAPTTSAAPTTTPPKTTAPATTAAPLPTAAVPSAKENPQYGGTLSLAFFQGLASMDPADSPNYSGYLEWMVFETLTTFDFAKGLGGTGKYDYRKVTTGYLEDAQRGRVAESWEVTDDKTIVFHIRKGLRYATDPSNLNASLVGGREVTAQDMEFAAKRGTANLSMPMPGRDFIDSWTATDKYTLVLKLKSPMFSVWYDLVNRIAGPYPPEVVNKYGSLKDWKNWVGTGPFFMTDFVPDASATFVRNPNYYAFDELHPDNRLPYIDGIKWLWIIDNAARTAAFRVRKIDMIPQLDTNTVQSLQKTNPEAINIYVNTLGNGRTFFNMSEPPFNDVRVRQALWMAVDFNSIVKDYYGGAGDARGFPMDPNGDYFTPTDKLPTAFVDPVTKTTTNLQDLWTYHPDKAKALLKDAGYPNGIEFNMTVNSQFVEQATILQNYWKAIGANAKLDVKDPNATTALRYQAGGKAVFKGVLFIQSGGSYDPSDMDQQVHTGSAWNSGGFSSPYFDDTYNKLVARMDLGPVHQQMIDLSWFVMENCIRLDFPLNVQTGMIQPWIKQYYGTGAMTGPMPVGINHAARLWIDQKMENQYTGR